MDKASRIERIRRFIPDTVFFEKRFDNSRFVTTILRDFPIQSEGLEYGNVLKCSPILKKDQELRLFQKFNYLRYKLIKSTSGFPCKGGPPAPKPSNPIRLDLLKESGICRLEELIRKMNETRDVILKANTRLIVKQAMRYSECGSFDYDEWISNGYCHILKAIDNFDHRKGFKFSTYCVNVIKNNMRRDFSSLSKQAIPLEFSESLGSVVARHELDFSEINAEYNKRTVRKIIRFVSRSDIGRSADKAETLVEYFGLKGKEKTLSEIGDKFGLTKERIRQMKKEAMRVASRSGVVYDPLI